MCSIRADICHVGLEHEGRRVDGGEQLGEESADCLQPLERRLFVQQHPGVVGEQAQKSVGVPGREAVGEDGKGRVESRDGPNLPGESPA